MWRYINIMVKHLFSLLVLSSLWGPPCHALNVVTHPAVNQADISLQQLRAIYTLQQRHWPDGSPVIVFRTQHDDPPLYLQFCRDILRVYPSQLDQLWDRLVFTGQAERPRSFISTQDMLQAIASTPGAIGYTDTKVQNVQVKYLPVKP
jgi:ABC-type phosphate transport system substrate-binding protein